MKNFYRLIILAMIAFTLKSCAGCLRNGAHLLTEEKTAARIVTEEASKEEKLVRTIDEIPNQTGTSRVIKDVTFDNENFQHYLKEEFKNDPGYQISTNDEFGRVVLTKESDYTQTRAVESLYKELSTKFDVGVCLNVDENGKCSVALSLRKNGKFEYQIDISSEEGFVIVGGVPHTIEKGFLGQVDLSFVRNTEKEIGQLSAKNFIIGFDICFPFQESSVKFNNDEGDEISFTPGSIDFKF